MDEILDVVDEEDRIIRKETRKAIHDKHLIHRGIHLFIMNSKGEVLLQKRSMKKSYYPGYLDASVGGHVESGESYEEAARRECGEELGFMPEKLKKVAEYKSYSDRQKENRTVFLSYAEGPFDFNHDEIEKLIWIRPSAIYEKKLLLTEGFKKSLIFVLKSLGR